ncbi:hypothetical protein PT274_05525 [Leuconostocaceae bacterium ESL0958]|nr:hypothetical protein [Leuconostocaceae bacterium ESL0958]
MTMVAATVIAYQNNLPYFLVNDRREKEQFYMVKVHHHEERTSLGTIMDAFKAMGIQNFDDWRLGELSTVKNDSGELTPLYSFQVDDLQAVEDALQHQLVFKSADDIADLLTTLQTETFTSFTENE